MQCIVGHKQRDHDKRQSQEREEELDTEEGDGHHYNDCVMIIIQQETSREV